MAQKVFEDKEFHGLVTFFKNVIIKSVGDWLVNGDIKLSATKKLYFDGGGDSYITEGSANEINIYVNGTKMVQIDGGGLEGASASQRARIIFSATASSTQPTFLPNKSDTNTGIGSASSDQLSLIAGGVESVRLLITGALFPLGYQSTAQQLEPTNSTASGNVILPNTRNVEVIAPENDANDWIILPSLSAVPIGHTIIICGNGGSAFEMRTVDASNEKINDVNADGDTLEYACKDEEIITVTKLSATDGWVATAQSKLGAIVTAVVPD